MSSLTSSPLSSSSGGGGHQQHQQNQQPEVLGFDHHHYHINAAPSLTKEEINQLMDLIHDKDSKIRDLEKELNESNKLASEVQYRLLETKRIVEDRDRGGLLNGSLPEEYKLTLKKLELETHHKETLLKERKQMKSSLKNYRNENKELKEKVQEMERLKNQPDTTSAELSQYKQKVSDLQTQVAYIQGKLVQELKRKESENEEKSMLVAEVNRYKRMIEEGQKTLENLKQEQFNTQRLLAQTSEQSKKLEVLGFEARKLPLVEEKLGAYKSQLEKTRQQNSELTQQLQEARKYIDDLQSERAQNNSNFQKAIGTLEEELCYYKNQLKKKQDEIEHYGLLTRELEADMAKKKDEHNEIVSKYYMIKEEQETTISQIGEYHQEVAALKVQLSHFTKIQSQYNTLRDEYELLKNQNLNFVQRVAETETELLEKKEQIRSASKQLMDKKKENKKDSISYQQDLRESNDRVKELQMKLSHAEDTIDDLKDKVKNLNKQLIETQKLNKMDKDMVKDYVDKIDQLNEESKKLNISVANLKRSLKQKEDEVAVKNNTIDSLKKEKENEQKKATELSSKVKDTSEYEEKVKKYQKCSLRKDQLLKEQKASLSLTQDENKRLVASVCTIKKKTMEMAQEFQKREKEKDRRISELEELLRELKEENERKDEEITELNSDLNDMAKSLDSERKQRESRMKELEGEIGQLRELKENETRMLIQKIEQQKRAIIDYIDKEKKKDQEEIIKKQKDIDTSSDMDFSVPLTFVSASEYEEIMSSLKKPSLHILKQQIL